MLACMLCTLTAFAQPDESKNFLFLYPDSVIFARDIFLTRDFTGRPYFRVDGRRVHPDQVKFFNNEEGFYANGSNLNIAGENRFYERIRKGKINVYEERVIDWDDHRGPRYRGYKEPEVLFTKNFYNVGLGDLKKATYANLRADMAENMQSIDLLNKYNSVKKAEKSFYIGGTASVAAGFILFLTTGLSNHNNTSFDNHSNPFDDHSTPNFAPSFILLGTGAIFAILGYTKTLKAPRYLKAAVDSYNR